MNCPNCQSEIDVGEIIWKGNPLTREGVSCEVGSVRGELMRIDPACFCLAIGTSAAKLRRTWVLIISDRHDMRIDPSVPAMASVLIMDCLSDQAMRQAETILRWAAVAEGGL